MLSAIAVAIHLVAARAVYDGTASNPAELGRVRFERDHAQALERARAEKKPVFLLFQEIPGCSTCKDFGAGPLTHPLLVEAIETEFVPCVVQNNTGGKDREVLERYREPAWNNPVVRFTDEHGLDLLPRKDGVWSIGGIARRAQEALARRGRAVAWLDLLVREESREARGSAVFAMPCFWKGQAVLGGMEDVVAASPAFLDGHEVVRVEYTGGLDALKRIVAGADEQGCAVFVRVSDPRGVEAARGIVGARAEKLASEVRTAPASDDKRQLARSTLRHLPLTSLQELRIESDFAAGRDPARRLSARQKDLARRVDQLLRADPAALDGSTRSIPEFGARRGPAELRADAARLESLIRRK